MFTGIITDIGTIISVSGERGKTITVQCAYAPDSMSLGESISCSGVCLTVTTINQKGFTADISPETIACTVPGMWGQGAKLNLERSLQVGERLGGHFVTGHVDGVGIMESLEKKADYYSVSIRAPENLAHFIAQKGSVTLDGISLTVNAVENNVFFVTLIPHTWEHTAFQYKRKGDAINIEVDIIARYLARLMLNSAN